VVKRYTVTAITRNNELVWSADFREWADANELYRSALSDPTEPVRRVALCRGGDVLQIGEVEE
jgi:hypothetical protein